MNIRNNKYWRQGYSAYDKGLHICPYDAETEAFKLWQRGHMDSRVDFLSYIANQGDE